MYTFLNQRYGLKSLIVGHASAVIKSVNEYSAVDNGVAVFGKILRNEIDEEFQLVQAQLRARPIRKSSAPAATSDQRGAGERKRRRLTRRRLGAPR